jgi:hypothetical protein
MAMLKFRSDATPEGRNAFLDNFPIMASSIPQIRAWSMGPNAGGGGESHVVKGGYPGNYDVGLIFDFDSESDYRQYAECDTHQAFFKTYVAPIVAERAVVQFMIA